MSTSLRDCLTGANFPGRDCPEGPKDTKTCYRCGQPGHISRDCPTAGGSGQSGAECYKVCTSKMMANWSPLTPTVR